MSFERITEPDLTVNNITPLADRPALTAAQLKAKFDEAGVDIVEFLSDMVDEINGLIYALEYRTAAASLGAARVLEEGDMPEDDSGETVQEQMEALRVFIKRREVEAGAGDMLKSIFATLEPQNKKVDHAVNADKLGGQGANAFAKSIAAQSAKGTLADNDAFPISDSADGNAQKKTLWSTIKTAIQTAFTETFSAKTHNHGNIANNGGFVIEPVDAGTCFVAWDSASKIHLKPAAPGRDALGIMPNHANQENFEGSEAVADSDFVPVYDVDTNKQKKSPISTILAGTVKNAAGITITVSNTAPSSPAVNDLWFSDESAG